MDGTTRIRRKILIVDRKMQSDFVVRSVIVMLVFATLIIGTMFWSIRVYSDMPVTDEVLSAVKFATRATGLVFVLVLAAVGCFFIWLSHKFAGPAYRLKKVMASMLCGDFTARAILREGDYLQDVAKWFNRLGEDISTRRDQVDGALRKVEVLRDLVDGDQGSSDKARVLVRDISEELRAALTPRTPPELAD